MRVQSVFAMAFTLGIGFGGCSSSSSTPGTGGSPSTSGGSGGGTAGSGSGGASSKGGSAGGTGGTIGTGGAAGSCTDVTACGGDVVGTWTVTSPCLKAAGKLDLTSIGIACDDASASGSLKVTGTWIAKSDRTYTDNTTTTGELQISLPSSCLAISGTKTDCEGAARVITNSFGYESVVCETVASGGCTCVAKVNQPGTVGFLTPSASPSGTYATANNEVVLDYSIKYSYCVSGDAMSWTPKEANPIVNGTVVFQKGSVGTGGATSQGGKTGATGGSSGTGGVAATGGRTGQGGGTTASGGSASGGTTGTGGGGGSTAMGPCDIYASATPATPCVAAYSMTRVLSQSYSGPLYQVRKGGSWNKTSGMSGGEFKDIGIKDGYADSATQDTFCGTEACTVSVLYDQSGKKNDLKVAPKGCYTGTASEPDSEGSATKKSFNINGHKVYALYMNPHDGMRNNTCTGVATKDQDQGTYVVADGTHAGGACCWDFGNTWGDNCNSHTMNPIFFGTGYWGKGAGSGPWFMGDFEGGVWGGGSGASNVTTSTNPSMKVEFAFGILNTSSGKYAIKAGNVQSGDLITAWDGASPKRWDNGGNVLLGIGGDNSNSSFGTFYEGALTIGRPSNETDAAVFKNVQAAGYGK